MISVSASKGHNRKKKFGSGKNLEKHSKRPKWQRTCVDFPEAMEWPENLSSKPGTILRMEEVLLIIIPEQQVGIWAVPEYLRQMIMPHKAGGGGERREIRDFLNGKKLNMK